MSESTDRHAYRLSVVWFTDLVGYSSLTAEDQDQALVLLQRFKEFVLQAISRQGGRVVKFIGDAALIESPSAESAVQAAKVLHAEFGTRLRTGIHLGDVAVASDGDLHGDGVNGAYRIQTTAEPGQIVVSEDVWRRFRNRPAFTFDALGERELKGVGMLELFRVRATEPVGLAASDRRSEPRESAIPEHGASHPAAPSVAVLPFANMSSDAGNEYFSDGITEEILTLLGQIEGLKVISRTSVMRYKGTRKPIMVIGEELGVGAILEGSVRHAGGRVRIAAQLINAATDEHMWADRYDRDMEDIFGIQSDVAGRIVEALQLRLTRRESLRLAREPTASIEAYQWYLKGRHFLNRRTATSLQQAVECFRTALTTDPEFAQAWVGLADSLSLHAIYSVAIIGEELAEARSAAENALVIEPRMGEAYISLGLIAQNGWDWKEARHRYARGIELSPGYATGYHWYGIFLGWTGHLDEAVMTLERALELDPLSLPVHMGLGTILSFADRHEEALKIHRRAIEINPGFAMAHNNLAVTLLEKGRYEEALAEMDTRDRLDPQYYSPELTSELRAGFEAAGARGFWEATLHGVARRMDRLGKWAQLNMAEACAQLGRMDEAFDHLEQMIEARNPYASHILRNPFLKPLRSDVRFTKIRREFDSN
ncbi:adenylate/guanylate cyclase domain-containing protein [soil metagenome]